MKRHPLSLFALLVAAAAVLTIGSTQVHAQDGYSVISTAEVKEKLKAQPKPLMVYALSQIEFKEARIAGSVCIPAERMEDSNLLPAGRSMEMIFYCKGPG